MNAPIALHITDENENIPDPQNRGTYPPTREPTVMKIQMCERSMSIVYQTISSVLCINVYTSHSTHLSSRGVMLFQTEMSYRVTEIFSVALAPVSVSTVSGATIVT